MSATSRSTHAGTRVDSKAPGGGVSPVSPPIAVAATSLGVPAVLALQATVGNAVVAGLVGGARPAQARAGAPADPAAGSRGTAGTLARDSLKEPAKSGVGQAALRGAAIVNPEGATVEALVSAFPGIEGDPQEEARIGPILERKLKERADGGTPESLFAVREKATGKAQELVSTALKGVPRGTWAATAARTFPFGQAAFGSVNVSAVFHSGGKSITLPAPWKVWFGIETPTGVDWMGSVDEVKERLIESDGSLAIKIGLAGSASQGLDRLWGGELAGASFECFTGAALFELRGVALWQRAQSSEASWRQEFDQRYGSFAIVHRPMGPRPRYCAQSSRSSRGSPSRWPTPRSSRSSSPATGSTS